MKHLIRSLKRLALSALIGGGLVIAASTASAAFTLISAKTLGNANKVTVAFSAAVADALPASFAIDNGITVTGVTRGAASNKLDLATTTIAADKTYTLTVISGVQDLEGNELPANSKIQIDLTVNVPIDFGQTVNAFQDDFSGDTRDLNWLSIPQESDSSWVQANGVLSIYSTAPNPNHLLYAPPATPYSDSTQEVLVRIRVKLLNLDDNALVGPAVACDPYDAHPGAGINFLFGRAGPNAQLLNDWVGWGPAVQDFTPAFNTWYWMRLRQDGADITAGPNIKAKLWLADGTEPEPAGWQLSWEQANRWGFAGIKGPSGSSATEAEVDYILIKADGLPSIEVAPNAFSLMPPVNINITQQPQNVTTPVNTRAVLTVAVSVVPHSGMTATYQWQKAPAGSTDFVDVPGAINASYTTPQLPLADNGSKYRCVIGGPMGFSKNSQEMTLTVIDDIAPPTLVSAKTMGDINQVTVVFSEAIQDPVISNFAIDNGIIVTGVSRTMDTNTILLATSPFAADKSYTLTVTGVKDRSGNVILPDSQIGIDTFVEVPFDYGLPVNGFQDDFDGPVLDWQWWSVPEESYTSWVQANGVLSITSMGPNPNHLLYAAEGYSPSTQEVLVRIRVKQLGDDNALVGPSVGCDPYDPHPGAGINFVMRVVGPSAQLLNDWVAWGPAIQNFTPAFGTWYWMRLRQDGTDITAGPNIRAKVWLADGIVPEPADWQLSWAQADRSGFAGIKGPSWGAIAEAEVDYILIKADGLPSITATPSGFSLVVPSSLDIITQPQDVETPNGTRATFTVAASGHNLVYQWQKAPADSTNFVDIAGATRASYTTPALELADNGSKYRCVVGALLAPSQTTLEALLTVTLDVTPPTLVSAKTMGNPNQVTVVFSEPIQDPAITNFAINGISVTGVSRSTDTNTILLATSPLSADARYTLIVNGIKDRSGNVILPNSQIPVDMFVETPLDYGQTVNGFQDDFSGDTRDLNWLSVPQESDSSWVQANGVLSIYSMGPNPNHLLYAPPATPYSDSTQEVLVRIRVKLLKLDDNALVGAAVACDPYDAHPGAGINFLFGRAGPNAQLLNDYVAWGPAVQDFTPVFNTWYWMRLRQDGADITAGPNIKAKLWLADGTEPEPANWQLSWEQANRWGLAGIKGPSWNSALEAEVDYILIKADGLPGIKVAPSAFALVGPPLEPPHLTIVREDNNVVITWTGGGVLEFAESVTGPWTEVAGASTPQTVPISGTAKFYRVRR